MQEDIKIIPLPEEIISNELLNEVYKTGTINFYDFATSRYAADENGLGKTKTAASHLVKEKLAKYTDEEHTLLSISNYGRYWILQGGYLAFLKGNHEPKEHTQDMHHSKEELLEARLKLTHFRLIAFWLTLILSILGFFFSLINFYLIISVKK
ncbi:MAG: hypothetical protein IPP72_20525 [Chitinophagaceae bacterium]|nr:hypothetical protein [Chitinophagaceae bacterium]